MDNNDDEGMGRVTAAQRRAPDVETRPHRYRAVVLATLAECGRPLSAQTLHAIIRSQGMTIGLSTVYRELHALARSRRAQELRIGTETVYLVSASDLLVCDDCGRTEALTLPPNLSSAIHSFFGERTPLTIHGHCSACATGQRAQT